MAVQVDEILRGTVDVPFLDPLAKAALASIAAKT
jgi:hypothetical protein